ncbi:uncharacterized protein A1O5_08170 [Cladophialophora psammophila CBS 110553]|uniref:C2H2-type domain-containing protein n=1 Tax=Cladophialophora psammophila CBS 110553 TaxID=1182543 RepID=W9WKF4_9EURO|nr:uncharacterized protein A1O5_08170 [Cladophialophora psammophila CBS 110553]EXJ68378.1 hypothetical protein A1O5_08170 [Cladophialophora psammophila CBS 110553]
MLPQLERPEFDRDSSLELMGQCSSLSSSFFSSDASSTDSGGLRRPSLASSTYSASPEAFWTPSATTASPTTPMMLDPGAHLTSKQYMKPSAYLTDGHHMFHQVQDEERGPHRSMWETPGCSGLSLLNGTHELLLTEVSRPLYHADVHGLSHGNTNPALTKSIFTGPSSSESGAMIRVTDDDMFAWRSAAIHPPAETIEPSVAFHGTLASSPSYKIEPSTPLKLHITPSAILSSSPLSMISPRVLPSQHDVEELSYGSLQQALGEAKKQRPNTDRLQRRHYERKRPASLSSKSKATPPKSGVNCELVIAQNEFACSYPGCIDKHTGKQKRFKRQEHKKRHEKTVHEKSMHTTYRCWVSECNRPFSRTDNLKSHLRNTHSKRPGVRGNRYVATLDKNSEFYDPDWVGELDKNGYPIH